MSPLRIPKRQRRATRSHANFHPKKQGGTKAEARPGRLPRRAEAVSSVHFSSQSCAWSTPQNFFDELHTKWGFELDVCASIQNAKVDHFFDEQEDGLNQDWSPFVCWMNPPYGREIKKWMAKALDESHKGATVVCLVPARTDTSWWHDYAMKGEIEFIRGRLKFGDSKNSAPFPSALVVFRPKSSGSANPCPS
jgi:phage N-6-adenine-methyltransferase